MKFYLRTGLGESAGFMTDFLGSIIQGLCQGDSAAPTGWSLISAVLINVYKSLGHGAYFETPITGKKYDTAGMTQRACYMWMMLTYLLCGLICLSKSFGRR